MRSPYEAGSYGLCPLLAVAGVWCPLCGGLRAVHELATGDLVAAWGMNPLVLVGLPVVVLGWVLWLGRPTTGRLAAVRTRLLSAGAGWVALAVLAVFGVLRNVPALAPWLAPGGTVAPLLAG